MPQIVPVIGDRIHVRTINPRRSREWEVKGVVVQIASCFPETRFFTYPGFSHVIRTRPNTRKFVLKKEDGWSVFSYLPGWYSITILSHSEVPIFDLIPVDYLYVYDRPVEDRPAPREEYVDNSGLPEFPKTIYDADE